MKIAVADLKKVVAWVEANTNEMFVEVRHFNDGKLIFNLKDKYEVGVEITLSSEMMAKIKKEDLLR